MRTRQTAATVLATLIAVAVAAAQTAGPRESLVVSNAWLAEHLNDPDLVILHVGDAGVKEEYEKAHIPGAQFVEFNKLARQNAGGMTPGALALEMPAADELKGMLEGLGMSDRSRVVVYHANSYFSPSTRVLQTLNYAGLGARTALLESSMRKWVREGRPTASTVTAPKKASLSPLKIQPVVVDAAFVKSHIRAPGYVIVDARDGAFYDGTRPGNGKNGHIPGAVSLTYSTMHDDEYALKPADQLAALFTKAGIKSGDRLIVYCHIGQQATAVVFAARTLGYDVVLYDGSFQDWAQQPDAPVEVVKKGGN